MFCKVAQIEAWKRRESENEGEAGLKQIGREILGGGEKCASPIGHRLFLLVFKEPWTPSQNTNLMTLPSCIFWDPVRVEC